jgi:uncharacterized protein (DUF433 family)
MTPKWRILMIEEYLEEYPVSYECPRVTVQKGRCDGRPCIRGTEITTRAIASLANAGITQQEILKSFPQLTMEDLLDVYIYYHGPWVLFKHLEKDLLTDETTKIEL